MGCSSEFAKFFVLQSIAPKEKLFAEQLKVFSCLLLHDVSFSVLSFGLNQFDMAATPKQKAIDPAPRKSPQIIPTAAA